MRRILLLLPMLMFALAGCRKDDSMVKNKLTNYLLLCPSGGISQCYDDCGTQNGISGSPTGSQMASYESCKGSCDSYCNMAYILILMGSN